MLHDHLVTTDWMVTSATMQSTKNVVSTWLASQKLHEYVVDVTVGDDNKLFVNVTINPQGQ